MDRCSVQLTWNTGSIEAGDAYSLLIGLPQGGAAQRGVAMRSLAAERQRCIDHWQAEYDDYWSAFDRARQRDRLVDASGNSYVPVTMQGEAPQLPQRGAWAFLQSIFPGRIFSPDDRLMLGTLDTLDANQREGLIYGTGWIPDGIWNYAASFVTVTFRK